MSPLGLVLAGLLAVAYSGGCAAYYGAPPDSGVAAADAAPADSAPAGWTAKQRQQVLDEFVAAVADADAHMQDEEDEGGRRVKRMGLGPSLSIVNPMDVLRQRLLLEIARRRLRDAEEQIKANKDFLQQIGKRSPLAGNVGANVPPFGLRAPGERSEADLTKDWGSPDSRWNNQFTVHRS